MRRKNRRPINEKQESKKMVYISVSILVIAILAFVITFIIYSNKMGKQSQVGKGNTTPVLDLASNVNQVGNAINTIIGKNTNEIQSNSMTNVQTTTGEDTKIAVNTSNMQKETNNITNTKANTQNTTQSSGGTSNKVKEDDKAVTTNTKPVEDPKFVKPVEGDVAKEFAKEQLVYSDTLKEWTTHTGVDIKAEKTTVVKAAAEGTIKSIKNDPRYGLTIVIEHSNGFSSSYSNLLSSEFVKEGEKVKQGQSIGTVGNTATFEIADETHLHFEILKNGEYLDPMIYIK